MESEELGGAVPMAAECRHMYLGGDESGVLGGLARRRPVASWRETDGLEGV